ncbi:PQQ-dependent sugar dehydrogenase [Stutzerimonas urumqiensis]|uniref:PQQ-dependent sugar dehydrogenase n=1 Tax=Stutzerimonas urumqiensis TaxID=638269 RepID=UPI000EB41F88|nr:PQQ-dependent sugar dehydrogenase [Stutzerimonas urumqiensis]
MLARPLLAATFAGAILWGGFASAAPDQPLDSTLGPLEVTTVADGLARPWSLAFLPGGERMLVTERPGTLRVVGLDGRVSEPLDGVPEVYATGQGGLLDVRLSPDFASDRLVYLTYAEAGEDGKAGTVVGRGRLSEDLSAIEDFEVLLRQQPKLSVGLHFGSRLVFDRAGDLFVTLGENNRRSTAQDLDKLQGKVVRLNPDGSVPPDNPFVDRQGARPEIWSYGHRNPQGAALNPWTGALWVNEHGPRGGDEINVPQAGKNYGWPLATHGIDYSGQPIPEAVGETAEGTVAPHHVWEVSPGLSGMAFYDAERFPAWQHSLFIGALAQPSLIRLTLDGDAVAKEERLLESLGKRIRDVRVGPDGYLYVLTDEADASLLRIGLAE